MFHKQNGNALLYVLIAVTLLAVLTYTIMGEQRGQQQNQLTESRTKLLASDLISHANSAELAFKQMEMFGVEADQVLFDLPGTAAYSTNVTRQIYHPSGGGLGVFQVDDQYLGNPVATSIGWHHRNETHIEWTPTTANDLTYNFFQVKEDICQELNKKLHGTSTSINLVPDDFRTRGHFLYAHPMSPGDEILQASECPDCNQKKSACVYSVDYDHYIFYNIIGSR